MSRGLLRCRLCGKQASLTAGAIFEGTRKPLRLWFLAMWFVTSQKNGVSALGLQRVLGLGSYETAWTWLHKLRRAMIRPGRDTLHGEVEVDETYIGAPEEGVKGRQTANKAIVAVAAEKDGRGIGRIRLRQVPDVSADSLLAFVRDTVRPGTTTQTDGWRGYAGLLATGYQHNVTVISTGSDPAHVLMPRVHKVASLLKRWLMGTLQGGIQHQHLDYYLDEFAFRFNRRRSKARGMLFYRLAQQAVAVGPIPYHTIVSQNKAGAITSPRGWMCEGDTHLGLYVEFRGRRVPGDRKLGKRAVVQPCLRRQRRGHPDCVRMCDDLHQHIVVLDRQRRQHVRHGAHNCGNVAVVLEGARPHHRIALEVRGRDTGETCQRVTGPHDQRQGQACDRHECKWRRRRQVVPRADANLPAFLGQQGEQASVAHSLEHRPPEDRLIPKGQWLKERARFVRSLAVSAKPDPQATGECMRHEVERPALVRARAIANGARVPHTVTPATPLQPFLPIPPPELAAVAHDAIAPKLQQN
jgi:transposase-like protein